MEIAIVVAVLLTSTLSGVFGMGGGILLMAAYAMLLPAPAAMVLHGLTQLCANGVRALLLRGHIRWDIALRYLGGVVLASLLFALLGVVVDARVMLIALGILPLLSFALPRRALQLDLTRTLPVAGVGAVAGGVQLVSGVAGPLLDLLFARSALNRHTVVATKAGNQMIMHAIKVLYVWLVAREAAWHPSIPGWLLIPIALAATVGTRLGRGVLDRLGEASFRRHADRLLASIGVILLLRGLLR